MVSEHVTHPWDVHKCMQLARTNSFMLGVYITSSLHHIFVLLDPNSSCVNGQVRLTGGRSRFEGRVEICVGGQWGTFCEDRFWDNVDAQVICRQIGYSNPQEALAVTAREYGAGVGRIFRNGFSCSGHEARITECPLVTIGFFGFCSHSQDVGVICNGTKNIILINTVCDKHAEQMF